MPDTEEAIEPIEVSYEKFISFATARNQEDAERASSAGESRQKIGEFLDETGVNSQALSWSRTILKKKKYSQQMDIIRSMEELLPLVKAKVEGGQSAMDFSGSDEQRPVDPADESDLMGHNGGPDDEEPAADPEGPEDGDPELAEEADDFDRHLSAAEEQAK